MPAEAVFVVVRHAYSSSSSPGGTSSASQIGQRWSSGAPRLLLHGGQYQCLMSTEIPSPGSPIFKAVQKKWSPALYRVLAKSPTAPEYPVGAGSEPSYVARSVGTP